MNKNLKPAWAVALFAIALFTILNLVKFAEARAIGTWLYDSFITETRTTSTFRGPVVMTGAVTLSGAIASTSSVSVSSSATSGYGFKMRGAYSSTEIALLSANPGEMVFNKTISQICASSATAAALVGAWIMPSTSTAYTKFACY